MSKPFIVVVAVPSMEVMHVPISALMWFHALNYVTCGHIGGILAYSMVEYYILGKYWGNIGILNGRTLPRYMYVHVLL